MNATEPPNQNTSAGGRRSVSGMPAPQLWATGAPVEGRSWKAEQARAAVLLTHGFGEYLERYVTRYSHFIPRLLALGFDVYGFDMRGHGHSLGPRGVVDLATLVADHLSAREQLRRQPLPVYAFGHSMGGLVTALSAAQDQRGLSGVVLSSPALEVEGADSPINQVAAPLLSRIAPTLPVSALDSRHISRLAAEREAYQRDPLIYHGKVPALTGATMMQTAADGWKVYPTLTLPTLVIHGTKDRLTKPSGSQRFIESIASPDKTLVMVEGGYHELFNDIGAEESLGVVLNWLDVHAPAKA